MPRGPLLTITAEQTLPDGSVDTWEVQTLQPRSWLRRHRADTGPTSAASWRLDSLLHHAQTVVIEGKSYRMKDRIEP